jgi:hypothetical protein
VVIFTRGNSTYFEEWRSPRTRVLSATFLCTFGFQTNWLSRRAREEWQLFFMKQSSKMALEAAADAIAKRVNHTNTRTQKTNTQAAPNQRLSPRIDPGKAGYPKIWPHGRVPLRTGLATSRDLEARLLPGGYHLSVLAFFLELVALHSRLSRVCCNNRASERGTLRCGVMFFARAEIFIRGRLNQWSSIEYQLVL